MATSKTAMRAIILGMMCRKTLMWCKYEYC